MANFTVNSTADSPFDDTSQGTAGQGTLRQGFNNLSANGGGVLSFASSLGASPVFTSVRAFLLMPGLTYNLFVLSGVNVTLSEGFSAVGDRSGAVGKSGLGTLTLTDYNRYAGPTTVSAGTLTVGSGGSLLETAITVAAGATFAVTGSAATSSATYDPRPSLDLTGTTTTAANATFSGTGVFSFAYLFVGSIGMGVATQSSGTVGGPLYVGGTSADAAAGSGTYRLSGGTFVGRLLIGTRGTGLFEQTGGSVNPETAQDVDVGYYAGSQGTYNLSAGSFYGKVRSIGSSGVGTVNQSGGVSVSTSKTYFGGQLGGFGTYNLSAGEFRSNDDVFVGYGGTGVFDQTGGSVSTSYYDWYFGYNAGSTGTLNLRGGTFEVYDAYVGYGGSGTVVQGAGSFTTRGTLYVGYGAGATGTYTLYFGAVTTRRTQISDNANTGSFVQNGGTHTTGVLSLSGKSTSSNGTYTLSGALLDAVLAVTSVTSGDGGVSGTSTFHFDGGLLRARASSTTFFQALTRADVLGGGAKIDTAGFDVTVAQALLAGGGAGGDRGLIKSGAGTLTLTGASTYIGATAVNAGTLAVDGSLTSPISVASGATLRGVGATTLGVTTASGATFAPGDLTGVFSSATLSLAGTFAETITTSTAYGQARVTGSSAGAVTLSGALALNYTGGTAGFSAGAVLRIIDNAGASAVAGAFSNAAEGEIVSSSGYGFQISYHGGDGNDVTLTKLAGLFGTTGNDTLIGSSGNDTIYGLGGADNIDGGGGVDTAVFSGTRASYSIVRAGVGTIKVVDVRSGSPDGTDTLVNVERLQFSDYSKTALQPQGSDYDGQGRGDLLFRNSNGGGIVDWDGANSSTAYGLGGVGTEWSITTGDLDGDGRTDIIFRNTGSGQNVVWNGGLSSTAHALTAVDPVWKLLFTGDFDGDGKADLFFRNDSSGAMVIWKGGDSGNSAYLGGVGPEWQIKAGDFDGDGKTDLIFRNLNSGGNVVWDGGISSTAHALTAVDTVWSLAAVGDFDGDGKADLAFLNTSTGAVVTWSAGNSASAVFRGTTVTNAQVLAGDFNGDGYSDLFLRNPSTGALVVWDGAASSTAHTIGGVGSEWQIFG